MATGRISFRIFYGLLIGSLFCTVAVCRDLLYATTEGEALWFRVFVLLALPFYTHLLLVDRNLRPNLKSPLTLAVAAFFAVNLLATIFGINPARSLWGDYTLMSGVYHLLHLTLLYFYLLLLAQADVRYFNVLLRLLVWIGGCSSVYGILEAAGMRPWLPDASWPARVSSLQGNPIFFASFLVLPFGLAVYFWIQAKTRGPRYLYGALSCLQLTGVAVSGTRGAAVALITGTVLAGVLVLLRRDTPSHRVVAMSLLGAACVSVLLIVGAPRMSHSGLLGRFGHVSDDNAQSRLLLWRIGWRGFLDRPLLGTGAENYYLDFYKHFDNDLYQYDSVNVVADKPHNYELEVLVTTGIAGFLSYLAIFGLTALAFLKAYRAGGISWAEFVILAVGIVTYHIQNLFVFDTPSASVAFYIYTAFAGVLWTRSRPQPAKQENSRPVSIPLWKPMLVGVSGLVTISGVLLAGITASTLHEMSWGLRLEDTNVHAAKAYFDKAANSPFLYDRRELGMRYLDFVRHLTTGAEDQADAVFVRNTLDSATAVFEQNAAQISNDPQEWLNVAEVYYLRADFEKKPVDPRADSAVRHAIALAPDWMVPYLLLAQNDSLGPHLAEAAAISRSVVQAAPKFPQGEWLLASVYRLQNRQDLAVRTADQALRLGYHAQSPKELLWLIDYYTSRHDDRKLAKLYEEAVRVAPEDSGLYASLASVYREAGDEKKAKRAANNALINEYADEHDYKKLAALYEKTVQLNPNDARLFSSLAAVYANLGEKEKAKAAVEKAVQLDPSLAVQAKTFLDSLQ